MPHEPLMIPGPGLPGRRAPPPPVPEEPQQVQVVVEFPVPPEPVIRTVYEQALRSGDAQSTESFAWARGDALTVDISNTLDRDITLQVFGQFTPSVGVAGNPVVEIDVGAGENKQESLKTQVDVWTPYVWCRILPRGTPTTGSLRIRLARQEEWT